MSDRTLQIVAGAQYGSEAKGHVTHRLVQQAQSWGGQIINVRVAGPNAGHTVYNRNGIKFALRQVPVGAVEDDVLLLIASGSEIDPDVLIGEIEELHSAGHTMYDRLYIDPEATIIRQSHRNREMDLVAGIGSTGKGIGAARADRLMRQAERLADDDSLMAELENLGATMLRNSGHYLNTTTTRHVVIEGTQGYGLGQHAGYYPKVTASDCRAIDFAAMAGVAPWAFENVEAWLVARVYPIRVAGNSGPMYRETTWEALGLPAERTTVTKKVRRVGEWDGRLVEAAVKANGGMSNLALTMVDQKIPAMADRNGYPTEVEVAGEFERLVKQVEADAGCKVAMVTTGPRSGFML